MPKPSITAARVFEDGSATFMARVLGQDGANITQASLDSIACHVYKKGTSGAVIAEPLIVITGVVYDALQTADDRWDDADGDATGFNFLHVMPSTVFSAGAINYRVEYVFIPKTSSSEDNADGTATGGGNDYILLEDDGAQSDDVYIGMDIVLTGGTGSGQRRIVIDYDHTAHGSGERYCQVDSDWTDNPDATTTYIVDCRPFVMAWDVHAEEVRSS